MSKTAHAVDAIVSQLTIPQIHEKMRAGELTSEQLTRFYLHRIDVLNPKVNAVITLNPKALNDAIQADKTLAANKENLGLLHGIPILLKDNIDTNDGMPNTAGSELLKYNIPKHNAFIVDQLKKAGAIILGKTNLSEWANFRSTRSISGWSSHGGQTRNPYDLSRSPCGSSSGSGAAIAAELAQVAVGTETDGSITCPSAMMSVVGFKPSVGSVSRSGIIPISSQFDTAGPMARSVTDAVYLLQAMLGKDDKDAASYEHSGFSNQLIQHLKAEGLKGKRIGIVSNYMHSHPQVNALFNRAVNVMREAGAEIITEAPITTKNQWRVDQYNILLWDFKDEVADYLKHSGIKAKTLNDLILRNKEFSASTMPLFSQDIFEQANSSQGKQEKEYQNTLTRLLSMVREQGIDATLKAHNLDILIAPSTGPAWKLDIINGDHFNGSSSSPAAIAGYPHITVPMGYVSHMPAGISFFASKDQEADIIEAAYHFEQLTQFRIAPNIPKR
ncbi:amidase [Paraneptunicella aestuarii]|uniref:amidase n=1 Tax=Paraneptunicella aestuarii TaxID=2831148 RepID=UPI001E303806|nr:amidase [Paraneptunicella aestuarii]UAA39318.1 amidase [Paraneptunicella aestuarii]